MEQVLQRSNLVLPTCCVELDREEMSYVEGGYKNSYVGAQAWMQISNYIGNTVAWATLAATCGNFLVAGTVSFETGVGIAVALLSALGLSWAIAGAVCGGISVITAIVFTLIDGGFTETGISLFGYGFNFVGRL